MDKLIDLNTYPVSKNLKALLKDKTTKKNIIFATSVYSSKGTPIKETEQMTEEILKGFTQYEIQPRVLKNKEQQQERTRSKAEVFTPSWICNKMNNHCDEEWFGRKNVFNIEQDQGWQVNTEKVEFDTEDGWKKYVDSKRLEITCGEAPYIVSRYDAATGELLELGGDKPVIICVLLSTVTTAIFSTLFGAGAVVAIGVIILPILMSLGIPKTLSIGSFMMSVGAGMYLNPVLTGQFLGFFLGEDGKQLITYDDPARLHWAIIGVAVQLLVVIVMCVVTLGKKKTVHAWSASAARKARPGYVPTIALIAPIIPVVLLVVFNVPIILGFTIGSFYALFVCKKLTSFRGACRVLNKDFYDGVVDTAPLVGFLLMIPMFNKAAELCVPYFNALLGNIIPNNTLVISIVFAILAPLGLFRGPFTLFGCGAATLGILKGIGFPTPYLYALMVIPSITMNVSICMTQSWIAWGVSYSKVSTREHLKMTLPYAWLVCIIMQAITYVMFG